ncbi:MAG: MATE family efflux transporter, partial [Candidatus Erginobacter occultus]|nr:MATE family efflux transporter [Candidatus Erginobacter occultus]
MSRSARGFLHNFIPARVFSLAFPVMLGMMSQVLLNVVDAAMVGQLGAAELAAAGLGSMAFMVVAMAFEALGTGTQILVAREWGGKNPSAASRVLSNSLVLTLPLGLLLSSLAIFKVLPFIPFLV